MSKKTANKRKNTKTKQANVKKGLSKKAIIAIVCAAVAVVAATVIIIACCVSQKSEFDMAKVKASLERAEYTVTDYVPEVKGYVGVTQTLSATYAKPASDSLADFINAKKEKICFVEFDSAENAKKAFVDFKAKWGEEYEVYNISGNIFYFGTKAAFKAATTEQP